jgi:hypothetical protein
MQRHLPPHAAAPPPPLHNTAHLSLYTYISPQNEDVARLTKRVLRVSIVLAVLSTMNFIIETFIDSISFWSVLSFLVSISIPACGYFGSQKRSKGLIFLFCSANLCGAVLAIIVFIIKLVFIAALTRYTPEDICHGPCNSYDMTAEDCSNCKTQIAGISRGLIGFSAFIDAVFIALLIAGFVFSNSLYSNSYFHFKHNQSMGAPVTYAVVRQEDTSEI